jgi:hypothetical protein
MSYELAKKIVITGFLLFTLLLLWVLNQKKNYNPVLSFKTNYSFKSDRDVNYNNLSNVFEIMGYLNQNSNDFSLNPKVKVLVPTLEVPITFNVLGRELISKDTRISIFEYKNQEEALERYNKLLPLNGENIFNYKNLIIEGDSQNTAFLKLKEKLNAN